MIAYLGKQEIKDKYIARVKAHYDADEIEKGYYWENGKGCAVGCTIEGKNHKKYEEELGIPEAIAYLEDCLFEEMDNEKAKEFPLRFLSAIKPGVDLKNVLPEFYIRILTDEKHGVKQYAFEDGKKAIDMVVDVHKNTIKTGKFDESAARAAARAASKLAADSAIESTESTEISARSVARAAAKAAIESTWSAAKAEAKAAAWSAAWSAARLATDAARVAQYNWMSEVLIDILEKTTK